MALSLTSLRFFALAAALVVIYFAVPRKIRWWVLLAASLGFYALTGLFNSIYILITAASTFGAALGMGVISEKGSRYLEEHKGELDREGKKKYKAGIKNRKKILMICCLILNFGLLCFFKYSNFLIEQINSLISAFHGEGQLDMLNLIVPLGISFYTFQSMGYLIQVYWDKTKPQKNFAKLLLFVSFFPQITQGPISEYDQLAPQLYEPHDFTYKNFSWGLQRFIWGLTKKLAIADGLSFYVKNIFAHYNTYSGITALLGAFFYSIVIYADFSGYMDMMCGLCEILGIRLTENFERPYFSKSVAEYWRRWHISLGAWFKTYIYYTVAVSKWNQKLGSKLREKVGRTVGKTLPGSIALVIVWFTTGLWHGASWAYIVWGLVNGLFIIAGIWLDPVYAKWKKAWHINENTFIWRAFQVIRTFILITFIKVLPEVGTLSDGFGLWARIFTEHTIPRTFQELFPFVEKKNHLIVALALTLILFIISLLQRKKPFREYFNKIPMVFRIIILAVLFVVALEIGWKETGLSGGFLYAQF